MKLLTKIGVAGTVVATGAAGAFAAGAFASPGTPSVVVAPAAAPPQYAGSITTTCGATIEISGAPTNRRVVVDVDITAGSGEPVGVVTVNLPGGAPTETRTITRYTAAQAPLNFRPVPVGPNVVTVTYTSNFVGSVWSDCSATFPITV